MLYTSRGLTQVRFSFPRYHIVLVPRGVKPEGEVERGGHLGQIEIDISYRATTKLYIDVRQTGFTELATLSG